MNRLPLIFLPMVLLVLLSACPSENSNVIETTPSTPFVDFSLPTMNNETRSLRDYQGKTILVNFWATWCAPCVAELPSLEKLSRSTDSSKFRVVTINVDSLGSLPDVKALIDKFELSFEVLLDPEMSIPPRLDVTGFPETFFVGPTGQLLEIYDPVERKKSTRIISDRDWNSAAMKNSIEELLKK